MTDPTDIPSFQNHRQSLSKEEYIETEKIRKSYAQLPLGIAGTLMGAIVLAFALILVVTAYCLGAWFGGVFIVSCLRLGHYLYYRKVGVSFGRARSWKHSFYLSMFLSGAFWGSAAIFFSPINPMRIKYSWPLCWAA